MSVTVPCVLTPGAPPTALTDAGGAPVGCSLINRGDNGGTVWITAGPAGSAVALTPGGSTRWMDPTVLPYAHLTADATGPETVLVSDQLADYSNPEAVAAATAAQLYATGVPNVTTGEVVWSVNDAQPYDTKVTALGRGASSATFDVSKYASLIVHVIWSSPTGVGDYGPAALRFVFPHTFHEGYGNSAWQVPDEVTFVVPVLGPTLTLVNRFAPIQSITVYGTNRPAAQFEHVPDPGGIRLLTAAGGIPTAFTVYDLSAADGQGLVVRLGGAVQINVNSTQAGVLFVNWPTIQGVVTNVQLNPGTTGFVQLPWALPRAVPVKLQYRPSAAQASGSYCYVTIVQA